MKELSIKEKAEAYDFSLKRAKRLYEQGTITESLSYVFPQLKKLGDGEVRKEIMQLIQGMHDADPRKERWLAWLEKQNLIMAKSPQLGEQKPAWSEEDENEVAILEAYIRSGEWSESHIDRALGIVDELVNKCKSSKDRVQPKQEWSVEDKFKVQRICKYLDEAKKYYADITEVRECMDWLKSLQQRIGE